MSGACNHEDKVFENGVLLSNPPQRRWICRACGHIGYVKLGEPERQRETFQDVLRRFHK